VSPENGVTGGKMKNRRNSGQLYSIVLGMLLAGAAFADAQDTPSSVLVIGQHQRGNEDSRKYCIRPIGDFNGDGIADHALSTGVRVKDHPRWVYILPGGKISSSQIDPEAMMANKDAIVLRGSVAAPFMCTPGAIPSISQIPRQRTLRAVRLVAEASSPIGRAPSYTLVDLKTGAPYPSGYPVANAINSRGHVVGQNNGQAIVYDRVTITALGTLGGDSSEAFDLNRDSDVVGVSLSGENDAYGAVSSAFIHDGFQMESLGLGFSWANGINDHDQIVGSMFFNTDDERVHRAFLYQAGQVRDLGTLGGRYSEAHAINAAGQVVGEADTFISGTDSPSTHAFIYHNETMQDLGTLGYHCYVADDEGAVACFEESVATDINNHGQIVGFSSTELHSAHAFLLQDGTMQDLGTLGGLQSWAYAINDSGQVVGTSLMSDDAGYAPFLYDRGTLYNLHELIVNLPDIPYPPYVARDINNFGQIVGPYLILDPVYDQIQPNENFSFSETLGAELGFEYWIATHDTPSPSRRAWVSMQIKVTVPETSEGRYRPQGIVNRWIPVDHFVSERHWGSQWRRAAIALPQTLHGKKATITVRAKTFGGGASPVVSMRHFSMTP
jgi:probable HAF family extracellular repeat protein